MILEAGGGRGLANGQCPRVHEVRPRGGVEGENTGCDLKLVTLQTTQKPYSQEKIHRSLELL